MKKVDRHTGPPEYPETLEGQEAFDRFRALTRRLVNVPKNRLRQIEDDESSTTSPAGSDHT